MSSVPNLLRGVVAVGDDDVVVKVEEFGGAVLLDDEIGVFVILAGWTV